MSQEIRAIVAETLASAGLPGFRDTTSPMRPQWRASFSFSGDLHGETSYVHLYVPADADRVQINCSALAPALDFMSADQLQSDLEQLNGLCTPGSDEWAVVLDRIGAAPSEVAGWEAKTSLYMGMQHRMVRARLGMPLADLAPRSVKLAVQLGLHLARDTRDLLVAGRAASQN